MFYYKTKHIFFIFIVGLWCLSFQSYALVPLEYTKIPFIYANAFRVHGVYQHVVGNPVLAKKSAIILMQRKAFARLWLNLTGTTTPPIFQKKYVLSYSIEDEVIGNKGYTGHFTVEFDKHFIRSIIKHAHLTASEISLPPMVIVPINQQNNQDQPIFYTDFYQMFLENTNLHLFPNLVPYRLISQKTKNLIVTETDVMHPSATMKKVILQGLISGVFYITLDHQVLTGKWVSPYLDKPWVFTQKVQQGNEQRAVTAVSYALQNYFLKLTTSSYNKKFVGILHVHFKNLKSWQNCYERLLQSPVFDRVSIVNWRVHDAFVRLVLHANNFGYNIYMHSLFPLQFKHASVSLLTCSI